MKAIRTCLWFDSNALEAAEFYVSIFPNSRIVNVSHYTEEVAETARMTAGDVMTVLFEINGREYLGLNGGPVFQFSEAISMIAMPENEEDFDLIWDALTKDGGEESMCGWLKDKFGLWWQIIPQEVDEMLMAPDSAKSRRVLAAIMKMQKLDIAVLRAAYNAE